MQGSPACFGGSLHPIEHPVSAFPRVLTNVNKEVGAKGKKKKNEKGILIETSCLRGGVHGGSFLTGRRRAAAIAGLGHRY